MKDLINNKYLTRNNAKNFGAGIAKTMGEIGLTTMKVASAGAGGIVKKYTGSSFVKDTLDKDIKKKEELFEKKFGERSRTGAGIAGRTAVALVSPGPKVAPKLVYKAGKGIVKGGIKLVKTALKNRAVEKEVIKKQAQTHANRVAGGIKANKTYESGLPRTPDTVQYKSTPIRPPRFKYKNKAEYDKAKRLGKNPKLIDVKPEWMQK